MWSTIVGLPGWTTRLSNILSTRVANQLVYHGGQPVGLPCSLPEWTIVSIPGWTTRLSNIWSTRVDNQLDYHGGQPDGLPGGLPEWTTVGLNRDTLNVLDEMQCPRRDGQAAQQLLKIRVALLRAAIAQYGHSQNQDFVHVSTGTHSMCLMRRNVIEEIS